MRSNSSRRRFLQWTSAPPVGACDLGFFSALGSVSAAEAQPSANAVQLNRDIEPVVRLLEDTPREKLLEAVAAQNKKRQFVSRSGGCSAAKPECATFSRAGSRLQIPCGAGRQLVHFAVCRRRRRRWLPMFWALDYLEEAQEEDRWQGDWTMAPVERKAKCPPAHRARQAFIEAMDDWDVRGPTSLRPPWRSDGANEIYELMFRYSRRLPLDRPQSHFRGQQLAHPQRNWLAICRPVLQSCPTRCSCTKETTQPNATACPIVPGGAISSWLQNCSQSREGKLDSAATVELIATLRTRRRDRRLRQSDGATQSRCQRPIGLGRAVCRRGRARCAAKRHRLATRHHVEQRLSLRGRDEWQ